MNKKGFLHNYPKFSASVFGAVIALALLLAAEFFIALFLFFPELNRAFPYIRETAIHYYHERELDIIQYTEPCTRYDEELYYLLNPGCCALQEREFEVEYCMNAEGTRSSEESLEQPDAILLGDSYAMGWGVDQAEMFSTQLEEMSQMKVLNAAISSYGTVRQLMLLKRLDQSNLKYLIIQHCENDHNENAAFIENNFQLPLDDEQQYQRDVKYHMTRKRYRPFALLGAFYQVNVVKRMESMRQESIEACITTQDREVRFAGLSVPPKTDQAQVSEQEKTANEVETFLQVLNTFPIDSQVQILVFSISAPRLNPTPFLNELKQQLNEPSWKRLNEQIVVLDVYPKLTEEEHYFILDAHLNAAGHQTIAHELTPYLKKDKN